jgi:uncharacterized protein involved in exopolysaccharide biosynthesis
MAEASILDRNAIIRVPSPSLRDLLSALFRQRRLIALSFAILFAAAVLYGLLAPSYESEMRLLVRRGRVDPPVTPQPTGTSEFSRREVTEEELNSEVELLRDTEILRTVVLATGLESGDRHSWVGNDQEVRIARAVRHLAGKLTVEPVKKTNLISVKYESGDPDRAAGVLKSLVLAYTEKHRSVQRPAGEYDFFERQTEEYRRGLASAERAVGDLARTRGVVAAALERDIAVQKLSDADASYRQTQVAAAETERRIQALQQQLRSTPERSTNQVRISDNPQLLEQLRATLLALELRRTELLTKYQPTYRLVAEVEEKIRQTKAAMAAERVNPLREETTEKDPNYEWARADLEKSQVELSSLQAREAAAERVVGGYRNMTRQLAEDSLTQQDLLRTVKAMEEKYLLYVRKQEEARIGDALDALGILNVTVVQPPRAPALPKRSLLMVAMFGFFLAGAISVGLGLAVDYLDPAFRTPDEAVAELGVPVLASLPRRARERVGA